jgi:type IV pilus assembly protein PilE
MLINRQKGFTIPELMIAITIIGILIAIAAPGYQSMVSSSRENDGKSDLYRVMAQQERYFLNNLRYTTTLGDGGLGYTVTAGGNLISPDGYYALSTGTCTVGTITTCVRITATGRGLQTGEATFFLQSDGIKSTNL